MDRPLLLAMYLPKQTLTQKRTRKNLKLTNTPNPNINAKQTKLINKKECPKLHINTYKSLQQT